VAESKSLVVAAAAVTVAVTGALSVSVTVGVDVSFGAHVATSAGDMTGVGSPDNWSSRRGLRLNVLRSDLSLSLCPTLGNGNVCACLRAQESVVRLRISVQLRRQLRVGQRDGA